VVKFREVCEDGEPVGASTLGHVVGVEQGGDAKLVLSHSEHERAVPLNLAGIQAVKIDQIWSKSMDNCTKCKSIFPG